MDFSHHKVRELGDLIETGVLWLINVSVFMPRGYAIVLIRDEDKVVVGWSLVGAGTEPWQFDRSCDDRFQAVMALFEDATNESKQAINL